MQRVQAPSEPLIYKFLPEDTALRVLESMQLRVSGLTDLNDVYDCHPNFERPDDQSCTDEEWSAMQVQDYSNRYGIMSFSNTCESPLLWGHYANSARGIALGFDPELFPELRGRRWRLTVEYGMGRPIIPRSHEQREEAGIRQLLRDWFGTKACAWKHELEVRYVFDLESCEPKGGRYFVKFPPEKLRRIVLGLRSTITTTYMEHYLKHNCSGYDGCSIEVKQARLARKAFSMELA